MIYSVGLTPSEVSFVKITDINPDRMTIFISSSKGDKNRDVILSEKLLDLLRKYFRERKPKYWLFEGVNNKQFPKRMMQKAFQKAVIASGITHQATLTILRNSFSVHMLDKGIDLRYVQKFLGHKSIRTTTRFLKVANQSFKKIKSPLDDLDI